MLYKNGLIFNGLDFVPGGFRVEEDRFTQVFSGTLEEPGEDLQGAYVIPGLVDVHNHGNSGADFSDGKPEGLRAMGRYLAENGVTSFAPASMTLPYETLAAAFATAAVQMLRTMAGDSFSFSMITTMAIQALWSMPPAVLAYFPPAKWIK